MNTYKVRGVYTISFEMEVEAENREEAEDMGYDLDIHEEYGGNAIFSENAELYADGAVREVEVELIDGVEEDEED